MKPMLIGDLCKKILDEENSGDQALSSIVLQAIRDMQRAEAEKLPVTYDTELETPKAKGRMGRPPGGTTSARKPKGPLQRPKEDECWTPEALPKPGQASVPRLSNCESTRIRCFAASSDLSKLLYDNVHFQKQLQ
jgi:hypothetical protein